MDFGKIVCFLNNVIFFEIDGLYNAVLYRIVYISSNLQISCNKHLFYLIEYKTTLYRLSILEK